MIEVCGVRPVGVLLDGGQHVAERHRPAQAAVDGLYERVVPRVCVEALVRLTEDVDAMFLLSIQDISKFLEAAKNENIEPRIQNADEFARKNRVLLLRHTPTETNIDISLGIMPFEEEMVERGVVQSTATLSVRLPTPEDLIIMKTVAHRPKDLEDIRTIIDKHPQLDVDRIRKWTKSFADILEMPALWADIEGMFK